MNEQILYSIRMRASGGGRHISGAERIVAPDKIDSVIHELVSRANSRTIVPDRIVVKIEMLNSTRIRKLTALDIITLHTPDMISGRAVASRILQTAGVSAQAAETAIRHLGKGAAPSGGNMRGAIIMDSQSGKRLEPDQERGVRSSRFDWSEDALKKISRELAAVGLTHYRTREALALATKVSNAPGMVAELCWSDEPDYTAGYVASLRTGYVRFPVLKENGDPHGGRVFFVNQNKLNMDALIRYLQTEAVQIVNAGKCRPAVEPEDYFSHVKIRRAD